MTKKTKAQIEEENQRLHRRVGILRQALVKQIKRRQELEKLRDKNNG